MKTTSITILFILTIVSVMGCSQQRRPDGFPTLYPASVMVIQDGKPLEGALVSLHGTEDSPLKWGVFGFSDRNGRATFLTHGIYSGVPEGEFAVTVNKMEEVEISQRAESTVTEAFSFVEKKYVDKEKTPLTIHIQKKGKNHVEFDVGKPVRVSLGRTVA